MFNKSLNSVNPFFFMMTDTYRRYEAKQVSKSYGVMEMFLS